MFSIIKASVRIKANLYLQDRLAKAKAKLKQDKTELAKVKKKNLLSLSVI
jgi:hypothetical protein